MQLALLAEAELDILEAASWYDSQRVGLGDELLRAVGDALNNIQEAPGTWSPWPATERVPPIRRYLLSGFPYALAYQVHSCRDALRFSTGSRSSVASTNLVPFYAGCSAFDDFKHLINTSNVGEFSQSGLRRATSSQPQWE